MARKPLYRARNWSQYNRSLIDRGNITVWFSQDAIEGWPSDEPRQGRGRPQEYSDAAIECCLVLRSLFHLPLRATQGFVEGLIHLLNLEILAETAMFRFKTIFGPRLASRKKHNQVAEALIKVQILNRITHLGMPDSYRKS